MKRTPTVSVFKRYLDAIDADTLRALRSSIIDGLRIPLLLFDCKFKKRLCHLNQASFIVRTGNISNT